eukprot:TRINITY_DN80996_c0_g1_i1.p1 TRINITY_DN80996_c0_g1~~TRINITY_DN80996_c0_g1_i1.p1  ORF type:complete len:296 (+),score=102.95 TRINITY_DN80996_c0_g1_i1:160-1047(+)
MNVVVIGATGTVGSHVVKALLASEQKCTIRACTRNVESETAKDLAKKGVTPVAFNFDDKEVMKTAIEGCDVVFLVAGTSSGGVDMVAATHAVVDICKEVGVKHVVKLSGMGADPESPSPISKMAGLSDQYLMQSGLAWTILRATFFMTNYIPNIRALPERGGMMFGSAGEGKTSYIHPQDIGDVGAAVMLDAAKHNEKIYNLTGPIAVSEAEIADIIAKKTKAEAKYIDMPAEEFVAMLEKVGLPKDAAAGVGALEGMKRAGMTAYVSPDVEAVLGKKGRTFDDFLDDFKEVLGF